MGWVPVESESGVIAEKMTPGMTFTYETSAGQEFWTVIRATPVNEFMSIEYLIVSPHGTWIKEFRSARRWQLLWEKVMLWQRPA